MYYRVRSTNSKLLRPDSKLRHTNKLGEADIPALEAIKICACGILTPPAFCSLPRWVLVSR